MEIQSRTLTAISALAPVALPIRPRHDVASRYSLLDRTGISIGVIYGKESADWFCALANRHAPAPQEGDGDV